MFSVGSSEIVNGEHLLLFCCDDGHQMWLSNYNQHNKIKKINDENSKKRIVEVNSMISKDAISLLIANDIKAIKNDQIDNPAPIIKNETVLKKSSSNLKDERSELLYMMNAQKKLFQQVTKKKAPLSISKILKSPIIFAYYTTAILAAILLI